MTGLDLESFLLLLRTDLTSWAVAVLSSFGLAVLIWLSWGSRRGLRKCLVASLVVHFGIAYLAQNVPAIHYALSPGRWEDPKRVHIRQIRVSPELAGNAIPETAERTPGLMLGSYSNSANPNEPGRNRELPLD